MARPPLPADPTAINLIGEGSEVEGVMRATSDVRVSGRISGELVVDGKVIVAEKGIIDGTLVARNADVAGTVLGDLKVAERLILRPTARIEGNVRTARLIVEEGAVIDGLCEMGQLDEARKTRLGDGSVSGANAEFVFEQVEREID